MKMTKRIFAVLVVAIMLLSLIPISAAGYGVPAKEVNDSTTVYLPAEYHDFTITIDSDKVPVDAYAYSVDLEIISDTHNIISSYSVTDDACLQLDINSSLGDVPNATAKVLAHIIYEDRYGDVYQLNFMVTLIRKPLKLVPHEELNDFMFDASLATYGSYEAIPSYKDLTTYCLYDYNYGKSFHNTGCVETIYFASNDQYYAEELLYSWDVIDGIRFNKNEISYSYVAKERRQAPADNIIAGYDLDELSFDYYGADSVGEVVVYAYTTIDNFIVAIGSYKIVPNVDNNASIRLKNSNFVFDGSECKPAVNVYANGALVPASEYTVTYENNTNVGTATVIVTDNEGGNYVVNGKATFKIGANPAENVSVQLSFNEATYTGSEIKPEVVVKLGDTTINPSEYTVTYENNVNAGTATVKVTSVDGSNYKINTSATFVINPKVTDVTVVVTPDITPYNGQAQLPSSVVVKVGDVVIPETEYTVIFTNREDETPINEMINVGIYDVVIHDVDGGNYTVSGRGKFAISRIDLASYTAPVAATGLKANGQAQALITAGQVEDGTFMYSLDGTNFTADIPTAKDAGTYTVYYKIEKGVNHNGIDAKTLTVTIAEADKDPEPVPPTEGPSEDEGLSTGALIAILSGSGLVTAGAIFAIITALKKKKKS